MSKSIISEGKTTNEAIENGLKQLNVSKNMVDIKVLESEDKRSFFSILAPRIVKVELTLKENVENKKNISTENKVFNNNIEEIEKALENINKFLKEFINTLPNKEIKIESKIEDFNIYVELVGEDINYLIGYRGDVLNSLQNIISSIANKNASSKIKVYFDMGGYREKRKKALEDLAEKISKTVIRTKKAITLEPMTSYERKIIHNKLQDNNKVKTFSKGEEPYRKVVIALK